MCSKTEEQRAPAQLAAFAVLLAPSIAFTSPIKASAGAPANRAPIVVIVHVTDSVNDALWYRELTTTAKSAADAFNIEVENVFAGTDRPRVLSTLRERLSRKPTPNYVVFANQRELGREMLSVCNRHRVDAFLFSAPLSVDSYQALGGPRRELKHWIGQLIPDDERAGYELALLLIEHAKAQRQPDTRLRMLGISGLRSTSSARQREAGLRRALRNRDDVELLQIVSARWSRSVARRKYELLVKRYGPVDLVWVANDPMALGVLESLGSQTNLPLVGGVDWIPPAIRAVADGRLVATFGGHFMDIALVLALLRNHYDGVDFAKISGTASLRSSLVPMDSSNVAGYASFLQQRTAKNINYRSLLASLRRPETLNRLNIELFVEHQRMQ